jgi:integrase
MTLAAYVEKWLCSHTGRLAPNSRRAYTSALLLHVLPALGGLELEDLTSDIIRQWLTVESAAARPANTLKSYLAALSTVLTDALIDGVVAQNAAHGAGRRLLPGRALAAPKAMTPEELESFLIASRQLGSAWAADAFLVYSRTGLRLGELLALQKRSLLLEEAAVRVESTYHGGAAGFGHPKGGKARLVELSPATVRVLERRADEFHTPGAFLFPGPDVHKPLHPGTVEWRFDQAAGIAALPEHYTVHSLRHTYASLLLAAGAPPQWVQQQLGHAHYSITVDLYGSWLRQRRPDLTAILDREPARHGIVRAERRPAKVLALRSKAARASST